MNVTLSRLALTLVAGALLTLIAPQQAMSQEAIPEFSELGATSQTNDYGRPGYPRVRIYLWGNAQNGVWTVEEGTDLLEFLSASATGNFNRSTETRPKNILKVYRRGQVGQDPAFEMGMREIFARQNEFFDLQNGDVLVVESVQKRRYFTFRGISRVTGTIASVASLIFLIQR